MPRSVRPLAKLTRPATPDAILRERLFEVLDDTRVAKAVWLAAAPGAGKTTLVSSYLSRRKLRALWFQLDSGDADPASFFYYLRDAAATAVGDRHATLPLLTPEYLPDIAGFARLFFRQLFALLPPPFVLVFDNVHTLDGASATLVTLTLACEEAVGGIRLIAISRTDPPAVFARLLATRALVLIDESALQLTLEEAREIAARDPKQGDVDVRALYETAHGWAAGLVLLLEHRKRAPAAAPRAAWASRQSLFDYFAAETYAQLPADVRALLIRTAMLPHVTARLAQELTGSAEVPRHLEYLCRHHHFTTRRSGAEPSYEYHALFREFLQARARDELSAADRRSLYVQAARLLQAEGAAQDAFELYHAAGDAQAAIELTRHCASELLSAGRGQTLRGWVERLPQAAVAADPWLLYWYGASLVQVDQKRGRQAFEQAFAAFGTREDSTGQLLAVAGIVDCHYFEWADFRPLDRWIQELDRLLARQDALTPDLEMRAYSSLLIALMYRQPGHLLLADCAARVGQLVVRDADLNQRVAAATLLIEYYNSVGLYDLAQQITVHVEPLSRLPACTAFNRVRWLSERAYLMCQQGAFADEARALDEAHRIAQEHGFASTQVSILFFRTNAALSARDAKTARSLLATLESLHDPARRIEAAQYRYLLCSLALLEGDRVRALREGRHAAELARESGLCLTHAFYVCMLACLLIENREFEAAENSLAEATAAIAGIRYPVLPFHITAIRAYAALQQGDVPACHALLREALPLGRHHGWLLLFRPLPGPAARLCAAALHAGIEVDYVRDIIKKRGLLPPDASCDDWPWPLKLYLLGAFRVEVDETALRTSGGKAQRKPLDLLKALVALGGRDVAAATLTAQLWPDSEGDAAQTAFEVTLHRLRKLLVHEDAVLIDNSRLTLNPDLVWVDVLAFERLLSESAKFAGNTAAVLAQAEQAFAALARLYRGHFLQLEGDEPWMLGMRDKLRSKLLRHLLALGQALERHGAWDKAAELYQRGIELDHLAEEMYRRAMISLQALGQQAGAVEVYRRCERTLAARLGVKPSPEMEALYRTIASCS
ncbi:MAG TPA: BTAD domain-containing putative transcriptional regulator [Burkholderiaceae bacterium]|nr:BTAD domain-containing putative transcriptional regulator [Burkholderiaceae bacterium]